MKSGNMGVGKTCLCVLVLFVNLQLIAGKPFFGMGLFWCDLFCEDDDDSVSATTSMEDMIESVMWGCDDCPVSNRRRTTPSPMPPLNVWAPPGGMNFTIMRNPNGWMLNSGPGNPWSWYGFQGPPPMTSSSSSTTASPASSSTAASTAAAGSTQPSTAAPSSTAAP